MPIATRGDMLEGYAWGFLSDGSGDDSHIIRATAQALVDKETWVTRSQLDTFVGEILTQKGIPFVSERLSGSVGMGLNYLEATDRAGLQRNPLFEGLRDPRRNLEAHRLKPERFIDNRPVDLDVPVAFTVVAMRERLLKALKAGETPQYAPVFEHPSMKAFCDIEKAISRTGPNSRRRYGNELTKAQRELFLLLALLRGGKWTPHNFANTLISQISARVLKNRLAELEPSKGILISEPIQKHDPEPDDKPIFSYRASPKLVESLGGAEALRDFQETVAGFDAERWREAVPIHFKTREELLELAKSVEQTWPPVPTIEYGPGGNGGIELKADVGYRIKDVSKKKYLEDLRGLTFFLEPMVLTELRDKGFCRIKSDDRNPQAPTAIFKTIMDGRERFVPIKIADIEEVG